MNTNRESGHGESKANAIIGSMVGASDEVGARGVYHATLRGYKEEHKDKYLRLHRLREGLRARLSTQRLGPLAARAGQLVDATMSRRLGSMEEVKATFDFPNVVVTVGKNFLLDNALAGSAYTAAFYMGLISLVSYTAIAATDTQASHTGWLEAGATNAPTYSGARKTAAWAAASAGSKALSTGLVFTFTGAGTVKGCFMSTGSAVDSTTGTLLSAGLFTGGDQPVVSTNTLTVTYTLSV